MKKKQEYPTLNKIQQQIIEGTLHYSIQDIIECEPEIAVSAFKIILKNMLSSEDETMLKKHNILGAVNEIRDILLHPYPQNRAENYPYFTPSNDASLIIYKTENGTPAFEKKGLLGLTGRNDNTAPPVTREAVISFIFNLIQKELQLQREKLPQILIENARDEPSEIPAIFLAPEQPALETRTFSTEHNIHVENVTSNVVQQNQERFSSSWTTPLQLSGLLSNDDMPNFISILEATQAQLNSFIAPQISPIVLLNSEHVVDEEVSVTLREILDAIDSRTRVIERRIASNQNNALLGNLEQDISIRFPLEPPSGITILSHSNTPDHSLATNENMPYSSAMRRHTFMGNPTNYRPTRVLHNPHSIPATRTNILTLIEKSGGFFTEDGLKTLSNWTIQNSILNNPECINILKDRLLDLSNFYNRSCPYLCHLTNPAIFTMLRKGVIRKEHLMEIDNSEFLRVLSEPLVVHALEQQIYTIENFMNLKKFEVYNVHIIARPHVAQALQDSIFSFNDLLKLDSDTFASLNEIIVEALREELFKITDLIGTNRWFRFMLTGNACLSALRNGQTSMEEILNLTADELKNQFSASPPRFDL